MATKVTIEVSATPVHKNIARELEVIGLHEVKAEEMIKSEISINPEFLGKKVGTKDSDTLIIEEALKKREELRKLYKKEGSNINPLVLVQLPDSKASLISKKDEVIDILKKQGI